MKDKFYPFFTYLIRKTYSFGFGKMLHFLLKNLRLLSNPMSPGTNLPNPQLVLSQFENLNKNLNHRKSIASIYAKMINPKILSPKLVSQIPLSTNLRFPIFVENRRNLIKFLADNQIFVSDIWYDTPIAPSGECPNGELAAEEIVNLPTHINVSEKDAAEVSSLINQWLLPKK